MYQFRWTSHCGHNSSEIFFVSVDRFARAFTPKTLQRPVIDVSTSQPWEGWTRSLAACDDRRVEVIGCNQASVDIVDRFALHDKTRVELGAVPH